MLEKKFNKALIIIRDFNISANSLCKVISVSPTNFSLKLNNKGYNKFTDEQKVLILSHLKKLKGKLDTL